jgi:DNA-directed RNA polymerase specialized sigma24 family protein
MENQVKAAKGSRRRGVKTPAVGNPEMSESQSDGVAAYLQRIAEAQERLADAAERHNRSPIQKVPPRALSLQGAAEYLGVDVKTVKGHIRYRRLRVIRHGKQRVRSILIEDLDRLITQLLLAIDEEITSTPMRA